MDTHTHTTLICVLALLILGHTSLAYAGGETGAGLNQCVQMTDANRTELLGEHNTGLLSESVTKEIQSRMNESLAVVFAIDSEGNLHTLVPETAQEERSLCNFYFPLATGDVIKLRGLTIWKTSNPKMCWVTTDGERRCIDW
jgi:hypothetical protein